MTERIDTPPSAAATRTWIIVFAALTALEGLANLVNGAVALSQGAPEGGDTTLATIGATANVLAGLLAPLGVWWLIEAGKRVSRPDDDEAWVGGFAFLLRFLLLACAVSLIWLGMSIAAYSLGGPEATP